MNFPYRSAAIAGAVYINALGVTEAMAIETFLFTFGKGAKDAARAGALVGIAEALRDAYLEEHGFEGIRIWTEGVELFSPATWAETIGLGAYRVGIRVEDETVEKVDVRLRRSVGAVFDAVLDAAERAKERIWRMFG